MKIVADLHLHGKYSRAVSPRMTVASIAAWAKKKGIDLVAAPDWTHPLWLKELKSELVEVNKGIFACRKDKKGTRFLLNTEIASIYRQDGQTRKIHNLVMAPSFAVVDKINRALQHRGVNLLSDGRPITGLSSVEICDLVFSASKDCLVLGAHIWTPWFSLYGSKSGFDSLNECYRQFSDEIYGVETGLSTDPMMNWQIEELDNRSLLSFSDAHSPAKIGREVTVFESQGSRLHFKYHQVAAAIKQEKNTDWQISHTVEFYPQEGKYHYSGHRKCGVRLSPAETAKLGWSCPVCGRPLTVGVCDRVEKLATRNRREVKGKAWETGEGVRGRRWRQRPPYFNLVPLQEILAEVMEAGVMTKKVQNGYCLLVNELASELRVLVNAKLTDVTKLAGEKVSQGIGRVRRGDLLIEPGYDGKFGTVKIWGERHELPRKQMNLF
jgi:uncharacterized protein (TIGR00375 family)